MMDFHIHIGAGVGGGGPFLADAVGMATGEALRYASLCGCRAVALVVRSDGVITDDLEQLGAHIRSLSLYANVEAFMAVELVHVPPALLPGTVREVRKAGAELVLVHGETLLDQVAEGTNLAAVEAGADILAHPGLIDTQTASYAAEKGVALELSACPRHGLTNGHVAAMAKRFGCALVPGSDARQAGDLLPSSRWRQICMGAAMTDDMRKDMHNSAVFLIKRLVNTKRK